MEEIERDVIWDVENNRILSMEEGVAQLMEGMVDPMTEYGLTEDEIKAVQALLDSVINRTEENK